MTRYTTVVFCLFELIIPLASTAQYSAELTSTTTPILSEHTRIGLLNHLGDCSLIWYSAINPSYQQHRQCGNWDGNDYPVVRSRPMSTEPSSISAPELHPRRVSFLVNTRGRAPFSYKQGCCGSISPNKSSLRHKYRLKCEKIFRIILQSMVR
jgi:hypothetical protein